MEISHFVMDDETHDEDLDKWQRSWFDYDAIVGDSEGTKVHHTTSLHLGQCQGLDGGTLAQAIPSPTLPNNKWRRGFFWLVVGFVVRLRVVLV